MTGLGIELEEGIVCGAGGGQPGDRQTSRQEQPPRSYARVATTKQTPFSRE